MLTLVVEVVGLVNIKNTKYSLIINIIHNITNNIITI